MKHKFNLLLYLLLIWQLLAVVVDKDVILPYPIDVFSSMITMLKDIHFYQTLLITLSHVLIIGTLSIILAFILAYIGYHKPVIDEYVTPLLSMIQAIPNVSFIILVLVWSGSLQTVYIVLFLVIFPLLYHNFIQGFKGIDTELEDVIQLYHPPLIECCFQVYLPLIKRSFLSGIRSAISLGIKVSVMAEVLAQLPYGVGKELTYCRNIFDMSGVFAWTLWLVIMVGMIDIVLKKLIHEE